MVSGIYDDTLLKRHQTCTVTSQSTAFSCSLTAGPADCLNVQHTVLPTVFYMALLQFAHTIKTGKFTVRTAKVAGQSGGRAV